MRHLVLLALTFTSLLACSDDLNLTDPHSLELTPLMEVSSQVTPATYDCSPAGQTQIPQAECEALLAVYSSTNGDDWTNNTNWGATQPCDWWGVHCDANGVVDLVLWGNGLVGEIPSEISAFQNLRSLLLASNQLTGEIPAEIGQLEQLVDLNLFGTMLTGEIPAELGDLPNLQSLNLTFNSLSGPIPTSLVGLSNLVYLSLRGNQLTGEIPVELMGLVNLRSLDLSSNQLTGGIPEEIGQLTRLEQIGFSQNSFSGPIPPTFGELQNLSELTLWGNQLTGEIPPSLGNLTNVLNFDLSWNLLEGPIPPELANLSSVTRFTLAWNRLTGSIPPELGDLPMVEALFLNDNRLTGEIPSELGDLTTLTDLQFGRNQLSGPIPETLGNLTGLRTFYLDQNPLSGKVPLQVALLAGKIERDYGWDFCSLPTYSDLILPDLPEYREADHNYDGVVCRLSFSPITDYDGPVVSASSVSPNPVPIGSAVSVSATLDETGAGGSDVFSGAYRLQGDLWNPMAPQDGAFDSPTEEASAEFLAPPSAGVLDLCFQGTDEWGNVGSEECTLLVVYDPEGGFVTGGGWIQSPAGAFMPDLDVTGKATFGFVSRYKKGANLPSGSTEFQFKAGNLNFQSSSYDWLVVNQNDSNAQFKGAGTINGLGDYKFMLWAGDHDAGDTFRIKIWEEGAGGEEAVLYDNGFEQGVSGGSIVIHTK